MLARALTSLVEPQARHIALLAALAAAAILGVAWLAGAAYFALAAHMETPLAMALVGLALLLPGLVFVLAHMLRRREIIAPQENELAALMPQLAETAQRATRHHPLGALAACAAAGALLAARPGLARDVTQVLADGLRAGRRM